MKRALADVLFFLGATAVVFFGLALFLIVFPVQQTIGLDRAYLARAGSLLVEFVRLDQQAVIWCGLFAGLVVVIIARLSCPLPRSRWNAEAGAHPLHTPRRTYPSGPGLKSAKPYRPRGTPVDISAC